MLDGTLATTNLFLAILAAVSVIELVALAFAAVAIARLTRRANALVEDLRQQLSAVTERVDEIGRSIEATVDDVKSVTRRAAIGAERAQLAFDTAAGVATFALASGRASLASRGAQLFAITRSLGGAYRILTGQWPGRQSRRRSSPLREVTHGT